MRDQSLSALCAAPQAEPAVRVLLAAPRGFCAGVRRAIEAVEAALERYGAPVYVRRPIVHNLTVVRALEAQGAIFVEELAAVPDGAVVIMSAHGIPQSVADEANSRDLVWFDAVCPLVSKVHREVVRHHNEGRHVILIGHRDHPEIAGTLGQIPEGAASVVESAAQARQVTVPDGRAVAYAVQTTYSVDEAAVVIEALAERFPEMAAPPSSDICYATTNRQAAIRGIAGDADAVIVAGESFSSNACRLAEMARAAGCPSVQLVAAPEELDLDALAGASTIGITAAASTPDVTVRGIVDRLGDRFEIEVEEVAYLYEATQFKPVRIG